MNPFLSNIKDCFAAGKTDEAIQVCLERLKDSPHDWIVRVFLGRAYLKKEMLKEARKELEKAVGTVSEYRVLFKLMGKLYEGEGKQEKAEQSYGVFSALDLSAEKGEGKKAGKAQEASMGKVSIATEAIAALYVKQGHIDKALETYREMLARDPANTGLKEKIKAVEEKMKEPFQAAAEDLSSHSKKKKTLKTLNTWLNNLQGMQKRVEREI